MRKNRIQIDFLERMVWMSNRKQNNINLTIEKINTMLETMNYGRITLVIQDNYVVQVEKSEKIRLK